MWVSGPQTFLDPPNIEGINVKNFIANSITYHKKSIVIYTQPLHLQDSESDDMTHHLFFQIEKVKTSNFLNDLH